MIKTIPILTILTFTPIFGALIISICSIFSKEIICKILSLFFTFVVFGILSIIWQNFNFGIDMQFLEKANWMKSYNIYYSMGIDGMSLYLITLAAFLTPICMIVSWKTIKKNTTSFFALLLLLEGMVIGTFCATDLVLFYMFFESVLIPMFFIIGIWGGKDRLYASFKFFLYTLLGSLFMLLGILYIYNISGTTNIEELYALMPRQSIKVQKALWIAFFLSFAVKLPMWPFHTWLPDAHVQAPTAGSIMLAGILLKLGGYGFLRISLPFFPIASLVYREAVFCLSAIAIVYTSLVALMQTDMKKLIAYSSIAHMGFVTAGIFSGTAQGIQGAFFQMISHGIISAGLFLCVGVLYERMHTKEISFYGGLINKMPRYGLVFVILSMASIGLPGTAGFIGEFSVLLSVFQQDRMYSFVMSLGMVLGAVYILSLIARVLFGEINNTKLNNIRDISLLEKISLYPLVIIILFLGAYPSAITNGIDRQTRKIVSIIDPNNTYMIHNLE